MTPRDASSQLVKDRRTLKERDDPNKTTAINRPSPQRKPIVNQGSMCRFVEQCLINSALAEKQVMDNIIDQEPRRRSMRGAGRIGGGSEESVFMGWNPA